MSVCTFRYQQDGHDVDCGKPARYATDEDGYYTMRCEAHQPPYRFWTSRRRKQLAGIVLWAVCLVILAGVAHFLRWLVTP